MGTIIEFPADAASRRPAPVLDGGAGRGRAKRVGTVVILPVVRIERLSDETSDGRGPEAGRAAGRRRRRRS
jgi:hypothetical protein